MNRIPNTLGVVSRADELLIIEDENSARRAVFHALENDVPLTILGGASNVVLLERVGGQVLLCRSRGIEVLERNASVIRVRVAAGEIWHSLVLWCLEQGIPGLENLALIPGSVGAAPIQNIGAYGVEVCEFVEAVEGVNLNDGELLELSAAECGFAYRDSVFKRDATVLVTALRLRFDPSRTPVTGYGDLAERVSEPTTGAIARAVIAIRQSRLWEMSEASSRTL